MTDEILNRPVSRHLAHAAVYVALLFSTACGSSGATTDARASDGNLSTTTETPDVDPSSDTSSGFETTTTVPSGEEPADQTSASESDSSQTGAGFIPSGYVGRLEIANTLDDASDYCLDVPGSANNITLRPAAWAHSCHETALPDQVYEFDAGGDGAIHFLYESYDLCLTAGNVSSGADFSYEDCRGIETQAFDANADGTLELRGTNLCLTVINMEPGGSQDELGVGRNVAPGDWVRTLQLQDCESTIDAFKEWRPIDD